MAYFLSVGMAWADPKYGHGIAGATGVANGGLIVGWITGFLLWGPALAIWSHRRVVKWAG